MEFPDASLEVKEEEGEDYELPEGNLLRGIDNISAAAPSAVQIR